MEEISIYLPKVEDGSYGKIMVEPGKLKPFHQPIFCHTFNYKDLFDEQRCLYFKLLHELDKAETDCAFDHEDSRIIFTLRSTNAYCEVFEQTLS